MENFLSSSFGVFLMSLISGIFTAPSQQNFMILAYGWSLASIRHTITSYLWLSGAVSWKHFSRFYIFLSDTFYPLQEKLWSSIIICAAGFVPQDQKIRMKIDDTTKKKCGRKIDGVDRYRNGSSYARQEYRTLFGLNFVYVTMLLPLRIWPGAYLSVPVGLKLYLKKKVAKRLGIPYRSRSLLAREILDFVALKLPHRRLLANGDGAYARKEFLRNLPSSVKAVSRFPINSKLYDLPQAPPEGRPGRKPQKGKLIGSPKTLIHQSQGWRPHPTEPGTLIRDFTGLWHSVLPGIPIRMVVVLRKEHPTISQKSRKRTFEAFFTTDLDRTAEEILSEYRQRWSIEIDIRDANAFYGLGQDQCRKYERIVAVNNFRMFLAAVRSIWFIKQTENSEHVNLLRFRPWYRQKRYPTQLDVVSAYREALCYQGISPTLRFLQDMNEINPIKDLPPTEAA